MVGDGDYPYEQKDWRMRSEILGIVDVVTFTGFVPASEAWQLVLESAIRLSSV